MYISSFYIWLSILWTGSCAFIHPFHTKQSVHQQCTFDELCWTPLPTSSRQSLLLKRIVNPNISILAITGPTGTGKSLFACYSAIRGLKHGHFDRVVLTSPHYASIKWLLRLALKFAQESDLQSWIDAGKLSYMPLSYMAGHTFDKTCILADDMHLATPEEVKMCATRIGKESRIFLLGENEKGLADFTEKWTQLSRRTKDIEWMDMCNNDIYRNPIVNHVLQMYQDECNDEPSSFFTKEQYESFMSMLGSYPF